MSRQQGEERKHDALELAGRLGWVTAPLLARWIWGSRTHGQKLAEALVRRLTAAGLLLARPIPGAATAYVLTATGAREAGSDATPGTGWGRVVRGQAWRPPAAYAHDLRAARFMIELRREGFEVVFDLELRRMNPNRDKYPDGVAWQYAQPGAVWVEVEQARKNGSDLRRQAESLVRLFDQPATWVVQPLMTTVPNRIALVLPPAAHHDERGYRIDHLTPLKGSIAQALRRTANEGSDLARLQLNVYRDTGRAFTGEGLLTIEAATAGPDHRPLGLQIREQQPGLFDSLEDT